MTGKKDNSSDETEKRYDDVELKSIKSSEISASSKLIQKYGVEPVKTSGLLSYNAYRKILGYCIKVHRF